jgi:hypothetical protein
MNWQGGGRIVRRKVADVREATIKEPDFKCGSDMSMSLN